MLCFSLSKFYDTNPWQCVNIANIIIILEYILLVVVLVVLCVGVVLSYVISFHADNY